MKATELIKDLQALVDQHGDLPVVIYRRPGPVRALPYPIAHAIALDLNRAAESTHAPLNVILLGSTRLPLPMPTPPPQLIDGLRDGTSG